MNTLRERRGQTLVEVIVAMGVVIVFSSALGRLILGAYEGRRMASERTEASYLAWEGLEVVRSIAEKDFRSLLDGTYGIATGTGGATLTATPDAMGTFLREITVSHVLRSGEGAIARDGMEPDPRAKAVTSTVTWTPAHGRPQVVRTFTYLTDWFRPRWLIDLLADFLPGSRHATELSERENGEVSLAKGSLRELSVFLEEALPFPGVVRDLALDPVADRLYVATANNADGAEVFVYDIANLGAKELPLLGSVNLEGGATALAMDDEHLYVGTEDGDREIQVVDLDDFTMIASWDLHDAATPIDLALDTEKQRLYVVTTNEAFHVPEVARFSLKHLWKKRVGKILRQLSSLSVKQALAQGAPTCLGQTATIYVDGSNTIVGGPDDGETYSGTLTGTNSADVMVGTSGADAIKAKKAADTICGLDGNDTLEGADGADTISGGGGNDTVKGEGDGDTLYGNDGNDVIQAGAGADIAYGGNGDDNVQGEGDADTLYGEAGNDTLDGGSGDDTMYGGSGNDTFDGQGNVDIACGEGGDDTLQGGSGNDQLDGGSGTDALDGESNTDTCNDGETLVSCEDTTTPITACPAEVEAEEVTTEERETDIAIEKFYALDIGNPAATAPIILHQSYLRAPRRIVLQGDHLFALTNSDRIPYFRIVDTDTFDHIADCALRDRVRAQDLAVAGSRVFVTFDKNLGAEFSEYPLRMDHLEDCDSLNRNARNGRELPDGARAVAVLESIHRAFITMGQGAAAVQVIDLATDNAPPFPLKKFSGVCDALTTIGSYLFGGCRGDETMLTVFSGEGEEEDRLLFGTYTSPAFDAGSADVEWQDMTWERAGTGSVVLRSRSADTLEHLANARWVGPDGTRNSAYADSTGEQLALHAARTGKQWMQWKAYLSGNGASTPELLRTILTFE